MAELVETTLPEPAAGAVAGDDVRHPFRGLVRRPGFLLPAFLVLVLAIIAVFPGPVAGLFGHGNPTVCDLGSSGD